MKRKITLLLLACVGLFWNAGAQYCGFDQKHQQLMAQDPSYALKVQQMNAQIASFIQSSSNALIVNNGNGPVYQIPVVVHVIHTGGNVGTNYNPSDAQITAMVNYLNQSYAATWPSYPNAGNGGTYFPLQFVLAKRTPNCASTNGIVRVDGSSLAGYTSGGVDHNSGIGAPDVSVKNLSRWPNTEYYNIWIVNKIDGEDGFSSTGSFVAGYAYFAGAPANLDGTIMLAYTATAGEITLPHEVGHAFSLYHTFEDDNGGSSCPPNTNCSLDGDMVCDTDPHMRSVFNCPSGTNPCTGNPYGTVVHNFMDYSSCQDRFTPGQKTRVMASLLSDRASLISSLGATPISGAVTAACIPTISNPGNSSNAGPRDIEVTDASLTYMSVSSSGYNSDGNQVYIDNTCKHQLDVTAGNVYNFSIRTGFNTENVKVFVDYNNDGTFQASEEVYSHTGTTTNEIHSFQYTVPTTATVPGLVSCLPLRMRVISDRTIAGPINVCGPLGYGQAEDYSIVIRGGGPTTGAVAVALTTGTNPSCFNAPLTFTATPGAGVTNATYLWYVNGVSTGTTGTTYSSSTLVNNDIVAVKMYFVGACGNDSSMSTDFVVLRQANVPAAVSIALTAGTNPGCAGQQLTFTATPQNGGSNPSYQWKVNNVNAGTNSPTFTSTFANNAVVKVVMTSNSSCASPLTATSNSITVTHTTITSDVTINLVSGSNPGCAGKPLTFEAQPTNGGVNPGFQWFVDGVAVTGQTASSFTTTTLANNSQVNVVMTATDPCVVNVKDTSNTITVTINPTDTPVVVVAITTGSNPGCLDSLVEFTANVTNHGPNPNYTWTVNGVPVGFGLTFSSSTLFNGDVVAFSSVANDGGCYTQDTVTPAPTTMALFSTPAPPLISFIGNLLVANTPNNIVWFGPGDTVTGTGQTYHPAAPGTYYAVVSNNGCYSHPSNMLTVSLMNISSYDLSQVNIYPNPTNGMLNLDWGSKPVNMKVDVYSITGQGLLHSEVSNASRKTLDLSVLANGSYFVVLRNEKGEVGTVKIMIAK